MNKRRFLRQLKALAFLNWLFKVFTPNFLVFLVILVVLYPLWRK